MCPDVGLARRTNEKDERCPVAIDCLPSTATIHFAGHVRSLGYSADESPMSAMEGHFPDG